MTYAPEWWPHHDGHGLKFPYSICTVIEQLHEQTNNSAEPKSPEVIGLLETCLAWKIKNWQNPSTMYERGLLTLAIRTLAERNATPETPPDIVCRRSNDGTDTRRTLT